MIFDLDGVLVQSASVHATAYRALFRDEGVLMSLDEAAQRSHGVPRVEVIRGALGPMDEARLAKLCQRKAELVLAALAHTPVPTVAGAKALLARLHQHHVPVAVATASHMPGPFLASCGLEDAFRVVVDGSMVPRNKPAPDVYLEAARHLGVEPSRCLAVDDAPAGVRSARQAGATVVRIAPPDTRDPDATLVVDDLEGLSQQLSFAHGA